MANLPVLRPEQVQVLLANLQRLPIDDGAKARIGRMLIETGRADRHDLRRLDAGRRDDLITTESVLISRFQGVLGRALVGLSEMDEAAFNRLVEDAGHEPAATS